MKKYYFIFLLIFPSFVFAQKIKSKDERLIRQVLAKQVEAWNSGNLEQFMEGYWVSDSLRFIGKSGITYGWRATLANYQRSYPDKASMGVLAFEILHVEALNKNAAFVIGKWHLKRPEKGDIEGYFSLLWRKIKNKWVICADHSS
ncbi:MAG: nuclear transport factor 2 family protein [Raineya sp.]